MAKLNGVKTLDMANGEITKVAYKGAEYAKTSESVKEGDVFQLRQGHSVLGGEVDAFYRTYKDSDGDILIPTSAGGMATIIQRNGHGVAFRKISAESSPTLEERVTDLETEVAALKGEKKSTNTFKIGDTIKVVRNTASWGSKEKAGYHVGGQGVVNVGAIGEVTSVSGDFVTAKFALEDVNGDSQHKKELRFDEIELAEETIEFEGGTYRKVEREAREGDVVISNAKSSSFVTKGKPYKVTSSDGDLILNGGTSLAISLYNVGRTRETVDVYEPVEQAKYVPQEGDIVVITANRHGSRNVVGDIGKITKVKSYGINVEVPSKPDSPKVNGNTHTNDEVRKATPAEVEKYEQAVKDAEVADKWAKIGRKPNEFKKGDVVRVVERLSSDFAVGTLGIVMRDELDDCCRPTTKAITTDGKLLSFHPRVELVAPVESLFNANA